MRRLAGALLVLCGVVCLSFVLTRIVPGDPAAMLAATPGMSASDLDRLRESEGLDEPLPVQFLGYLGNLLQGDLGRSTTTGLPVAAEIARRVPATLELALAGFSPALIAVVVLGLASARNPGGFADTLARGASAAGAALPLFVSGLLLIHIFYVRAGLAPEPSGRFPAFSTPPPTITGFLLVDAVLARDLAGLRAAAAQLALPALTMALFALAPMLRIFRAGMLAALDGPGVQGARALGLSERVVLTRYALPEALARLVPVALLTFGYMMGANVLVEKVFSWPGIGRYALDALGMLDHAPVQGVMLVLAVVHVALSAFADFLQQRLDQRVADG
jgi:ABC-type dipeptide/oligopeptide/nickel transport system permease component